MQVAVKTPRIELEMKGDIPERVILFLEEEYGVSLRQSADNGEEFVNALETDWYKRTMGSMTPGKALRICVFHDIRPVIPREGGHAFHVIPAACSSDSGQAVGAKRRGWLLGTSFLGVTSSWLSFSASILL